MAIETQTMKHNELSLGAASHDHRSSSDNSNNINNNNGLKFGSGILPLTAQNTLPDGFGGPQTSPFLAPPSLFPRERRHSTSSCDSSVSQGSRRRLRRNSSSRLSDYEEDTRNITLLTFARAAKMAYKRIWFGVRKAVNMLFVSRPRQPNIVCEAEVVEQAVWITTDYVIARLSSRQLMSRKVGLTSSDWSRSVHVINAGFALEMSYPKIYSNVSRKLCMTMSTTKIVRSTMVALFNILFEDSVTWGKIVSMFAVAGLFAEECASQGHADYVKEVVDVVTDFISAHLLSWLVSQGGWDAFPVPGNNEKSRLSKSRLLILTAATTAIAMSTSAFLDLW